MLRGVGGHDAFLRTYKGLHTDAEAAELHLDGRCEVAGSLERVNRLEGIAAVAVVLCRMVGKLPGELFGDRHEAGAGVRIGS